jgi:hypothetical protein
MRIGRERRRGLIVATLNRSATASYEDAIHLAVDFM